MKKTIAFLLAAVLAVTAAFTAAPTEAQAEREYSATQLVELHREGNLVGMVFESDDWFWSDFEVTGSGWKGKFGIHILFVPEGFDPNDANSKIFSHYTIGGYDNSIYRRQLCDFPEKNLLPTPENGYYFRWKALIVEHEEEGIYICLTPLATPISYTIEYRDTYGLSNGNPVMYTIESGDIALAPLAGRSGFHFNGWYDSAGNKVDKIAGGSTGNRVLTAGWREETPPPVPTGVEAASAAYDKVKISWGETANAKGYQVYRALSKKGTYKKAATTGDTSWTNKKLRMNKTYYYKVRAYGTVKGQTVYSGFSKVVKAAPRPGRPVLKLSAKKGKVKAKWTKVSGTTKYQVYRANKSKGKYAVLKQTKKTGYTDKKVKKGRTYHYKVRAYRTFKGKKYYGKFSDREKIKVKK